MTRLTVRAYAKVNLTLEVLGARDDGYHEIASIMQTVDVNDTVTLEHADDITLKCDRPELDSPENLALRAARLLRAHSGYDGGARVTLDKSIPVSAGLGGGSSDAAATLNGLNELWGLGMSNDELARLGAELGSDVPFFLTGGTAMALGRGERVRALPPADLKWLLLLSPPIRVPDKTRAVYARLNPASFTGGLLTRKLEARIRGGGDVPPQFLFNVFDGVAREVFPGLDEFWRAIEELGGREVHLAGSGPSLFAPVSRREVGTAMELVLRSRYGWDARLVSCVQPDAQGGP